MVQVRSSCKQGHDVLKEQYLLVDRKLEELKTALTNLRFESKVHRGKNVGTAARSAAFLNDQWLRCLEFEEDVLFPFVEARVPKLNVLLSHLQIDHIEQRKNVLQLVQKLDHLKTSEADDLVQDIESCFASGMYVICFIRNHIFIKNNLFYKTVTRNLKDSDEKEFHQLLSKTKTFFLN